MTKAVDHVEGDPACSLSRDSWDGRPGDLIVIPQAQHSVEAPRDSAILLTVGKTS